MIVTNEDPPNVEELSSYSVVQIGWGPAVLDVIADVARAPSPYSAP